VSGWSYTGGAILSVGGVALDTEPATYVDRTSPLEKRTAVTSRDLVVSGVCIPFGIALSDGRGGHERFTTETRWHYPPGELPLKVQHKTVVGGATVEWAPSGMHLRGTVLGPCVAMLEQRRELSVGFAPLKSHLGADGVRTIDEAILFECSLVTHAAYRPFTVAAILTAPDEHVEAAKRPAMSPIPPRPRVNLEPVPLFG
jgi:hypothetical protein